MQAAADSKATVEVELRSQLEEMVAERSECLKELRALHSAEEASSTSARMAKAECESTAKELEALRESHAALEKRHLQQSEELAKAIGHQNLNQKIQHHVKIKNENNALKQVSAYVRACRASQ